MLTAKPGATAPTPHAPSLDQNNISPEEMSAVSPPTPTLNTDTLTDNETPIEDVPQVEETPTEPPPAPAVSSQLALLARKEKAQRLKQQQQDQAFKAREEALKAREAAADAKERQYNQGYVSQDVIKKQTLKVLADAGVSYDDLTQQVLNQSQTNPYTESQIAKLEAKIQQLESKAEASQKQYSTQQEQAMEAATKQIRVDVRNLVKSDPAYETVKATGSTEDVVDLIKRTYAEDGYIMSTEEATQEVEDYLVEEALKLTRIQKIQKRMQASATPAPTLGAKTPQTPKQPQPMKTLTNATGSTRPLTARERAIAAAEGRLK